MNKQRKSPGRQAEAIQISKIEVTDQYTSTFENAIKLHAAGYSFIPIRADGSKRPLLKWESYAYRQPTEREVADWFGLADSFGLGIVCGVNRVEVLDFDEPIAVRKWARKIGEDGGYSLLNRLLVVSTPSGGRHVIYRCGQIAGNQKLARSVTGKTLIETRGQGGYILSPFAPPECHKTGGRYVSIQGDIFAPPLITPEERQFLMDTARQLDELPSLEIERTPARIFDGDDTRPGTAFNNRVNWKDVLIPHGWKLVHRQGSKGYWRRPGDDAGHHATTDHAESDLLWIFSPNCYPLEANRSYDKFMAYALLNHAGDVAAAGRELIAQGYGTPHRKQHDEPDATELAIAEIEAGNYRQL